MIENVGNFQIDARDRIVVLTHMRGSLSLHLHQKVSYDHQQRRSIVCSRILCLLISAELPEKHIEKMKNLLIVSLFLVLSCMVFAQNSSMNDTVVREFQFPLTQKETEPVFYYFNNEWIALPDHAVIQADSIQKAEVKNDEYGNRAVFLTVTPTYLARLKAEVRRSLINLDHRCEFPGGNGKFKEWLDSNIRIPEGFKGTERIIVEFYVQPDGTVTDPKIIRKRSKNEAVNAEALRLVNALPKFRVKYCTPKKYRITYLLPITFNEPGAVYIRGGESSFIEQFPVIETRIRQLYSNVVFNTVKDPNFKISEICTAGFLKRLKQANEYDAEGYATWLLRSGMQDGDNTPSEVLSIVPCPDNTVIVNWTDMGHKGSTTFTMVETDGEWKIDDATVPPGYNL